LPLQSSSRLVSWGAATGLYGLALPFFLGPLFVTFGAAELVTRITLCVALIAPAGMLLGFGFPTGMRLVSLIDAKPTPWFWGINGAAGVLASIIAVTLSLALGIGATLVLGALCYLSLIPVSLALLAMEKPAVSRVGAKPQDAARKPRARERSRIK
jgi:hypothetical protein